MEDQVQSQTGSREICGAKNGTVTDFSISTLLAFPCQCHSINTPFHSLTRASPEATDGVHNSHTLPSTPRVLILNPPSPPDITIL
jgi:hypothetical protein